MGEINKNLNYIATTLIIAVLVAYSIDAYITEHDLMHSVLAAVLIVAILLLAHTAKHTVTSIGDNSHLLNQLDIGISTVDGQGRIIFCNRKALSLFRLNSNCKAFPHTISEALDIQWKAQEGDAYQMTCFRNKQNERIIIECITKKTASNNEIRFTVIMRDITQRINVDAELANYQARLEELVEQRSHALSQARDRAIAANEEKNTLISNMTHELRTPLNAILGYCELLQDEIRDNNHTAYLDDLEKIHQSTLTLSKLVDNVLDIQEIEKGIPQLNISNTNIKNIVDEIINEYDIAAKEKNNSINVIVQSEENIVEGDENKIKRILQNLISNAVKFTENGRINITINSFTRHHHDFITIGIKDNGIGIAESDLDMIFKKFTQVDSSSTREFSGAGLGLTISKKLAQVMGGDITVESRLNIGSIFTLTLPINTIRSDVDPALIRFTPRPPKTADCRKIISRILTIDNNPLTQTVLCRFLAQQGFYTESANHFEAAKKAIIANPPNLILIHSENHLNNEGRLIAQIKGLEETRNTPIVYISGKANSELLSPLGLSNSIRKPFIASDIERAINLTPLTEKYNETGARTVLALNLDDESNQVLAQLLSERHIVHIAANDTLTIAPLLDAQQVKHVMLGINYKNPNLLATEEIVEQLKTKHIPVTFILDGHNQEAENRRYQDLVTHIIDSDPLSMPDLLLTVKQTIVNELRNPHSTPRTLSDKHITIY